MQNKGTNMRLSREAKKVKKDFENQIKKHGKISDNYVCCPDLEDPLTWWYVIFGLEGYFEGGYYFGKVVCPQDYPARPPYITVLTKNGHFVAGEKVCLSITDYHPESWNPAWTVTHVILGMISFWLGGEETAGSQYYYGKDGMNVYQEKKHACIDFAMKSRESVLNEPKYKDCLEYYSEFIGIKNEIDVPAWKTFKEEAEKLKIAAEEKAKLEAIKAEKRAKWEAERKLKEEEEARKLKEEAEAKAKAEALIRAAERQEAQDKEKVANALKNAYDGIQALFKEQESEDEQKSICALFDEEVIEEPELAPMVMRKVNSTPA